MRILFLPAYYYPEHAASSYLGDDLRKALCDGGTEIVLYAPTPCRGISKEVRKEYSSKGRKKEVLFDGRLLVYRFNLPREGKNPFARFLRYVLCWFKQLNRGLITKGVDCIFLASTPPIQGLLGVIIKTFKRVPFIYNLQDVFPDSLVGTGLARKGGFIWTIGRVIEYLTYRSADKIIVISEDFKKNLLAKGVPEEKIEVIYNWVDETAVLPVTKEENPLFEEFEISREKFTLVYAGNLGNAQNIGVILDAADMLPDVQFAIFGTGGLEGEIRKHINRKNLTNVFLNPLQPIERVSYVYSLGDACIVTCKAGLGGSAMPSKTWTIMSCARPVVANFDEGELKEILEKNNCGFFSHAGNACEFVDTIKTLEENRVLCREMGVNARRFIMENLTKEVGTSRYVKMIKSFEKI